MIPHLSKFFEQRKIYLFSILFLIGLFYLQIHFFYPHLFFLDDPYIVLHSAQVMQRGYDINYPGTPALTGNSSSVHLLLTYLLLFFFPPIYALIITNWLAILAYALGLIYLSSLYRCSTWQTIFLLCCGLFSGVFMAQLLNGLETSLAAAVMVWLLVFASLPLTLKNRIALALLLGIAPFIRPELMAFSLSLYGFQWYRYQKNHCATMKNILQDLSFIFLAALPWLIWAKQTTGYFYPETISAKSTFFADYYPHFFARLSIFINVLLHFLLTTSVLYLVSFYFLTKQKIGQAVLLFIIIFCSAYLFTEPNILMQNNFRYFYLLIPLFLFGFIIHSKAFATTVIIFLIALCSISALPMQYVHYQKMLIAMGQIQDQYTAWCNTHLPQHAVIAVQDAGFITYATPFALTDFVGLKSPDNIALHQQYTKPSHGFLRTQAISLILKKKQAHYLILTQSWVNIFQIPAQLQALGWQVTLLKKVSSDLPDDKENAYLIYYIR